MGYKLGDWLKHKHVGDVIEITEVRVTDDGIHSYSVKRIDTETGCTKARFNINYSILNMFYDHMPLARLLYYKESNK